MFKVNRARLRLGTVTVAALAIAGIAAATPSIADPGAPAAQDQTNAELVGIKDPVLRDCVSKALGGQPASTLTTLYCPSAENYVVKDLTGISVLKNLTKLSMWSGRRQNEFTDLSPLTGLGKLTILYLGHGSNSDVSPLSGLTNLTELSLDSNNINDIKPLSGLKNLTTLNLGRNTISNLQPLSGLTNLTTLNLNDNTISDLQPLSRLVNLTNLDLDMNTISNLQPLSRLTNLTYLGLLGNKVSNLQPIPRLTNLTNLEIGSNNISDISQLSKLTKLNTISLTANKITNVSPLAKLAATQDENLLMGVWNQKATGSPAVAGKATPIVLKDFQGKTITDLAFSGPGTPTVNQTTGTVTYPVAGTYTVTWNILFGTRSGFYGTLTQQVNNPQPRR